MTDTLPTFRARRRRELARALADGPLSVLQLAERTGRNHKTVLAYLAADGWFERVRPGEYHGPWRLTAVGRAGLAEPEPPPVTRPSTNGPCAHCGVVKWIQSRGLCRKCDKTAGVRGQYPRQTDSAPNRGDNPETMAELEARIAARIAEGLPRWWHTSDAYDTNSGHDMPDASRTEIYALRAASMRRRGR